VPAPISAKTALCGIVLHPAGHTRSPAMHNAAFRALDLDAVYLAFDVPPAALPGAIAGARALGVRQLAVSLPHKQAVMAHLDAVDDTARRIGAVNTVTRRPDGTLAGANTDWIGAVRALEREGPLAGARAVVLGAGGAARAVVHGLVVRGAHVVVLNRTPERARELAQALGAQESGALGELARLAYDVLVNATSVGLGCDESPVPAEALRPGVLVMDTVYEPERTRLLRDAQKRGARILGGKWMLVHQAAEQLRLWTGREAPLEVMAAAFDAAAPGANAARATPAD
jgi:shikimate dehydrogenase